MIKRPSFPVPSRLRAGSSDHRLSVVVLALAIIVAAALLVRFMGPIPQTESDPDSYAVGP